MGGTIAVGVRYLLPDKSGVKQQFMLRWTNDLPLWVIAPDFLNGGESFQEFINSGNATSPQYNQDYCRNTESLCSDAEYGFLLLDMINRKACFHTHYSNFGTFSYFSVDVDLSNELPVLLSLCNMGAIGDVSVTSFEESTPKQKTVEEFITFAQRCLNCEVMETTFWWKLKLKPEFFEFTRIEDAKVKEISPSRSAALSALSREWMRAQGWGQTQS